MKKYFEEQLKDKKPIKKEVLKELKGRSFYSEYQEGDEVAVFLEQKLGTIEPPNTEPSITLSLHMIVEREIDKLEKDFTFVRMSQTFPVLERKENEKSNN